MSLAFHLDEDADADDEIFPNLVHSSRRDDASLRELIHDMGDDVAVEGFIRQQTAIQCETSVSVNGNIRGSVGPACLEI